MVGEASPLFARGRLVYDFLMKVFLIHSIRPDDGPVASRLRAVAAAYGVSVVLPLRGTLPLSGETRSEIANSAAVIVLATTSAIHDPHVAAEAHEAIRLRKPMVALVEKGVILLRELDASHVVRFARENPAAHEQELLRALKSLGKTGAPPLAAVGWIAGIAVALVGLAAVLAGAEEEEHPTPPKRRRRPVPRRA